MGKIITGKKVRKWFIQELPKTDKGANTRLTGDNR